MPKITIIKIIHFTIDFLLAGFDIVICLTYFILKKAVTFNVKFYSFKIYVHPPPYTNQFFVFHSVFSNHKSSYILYNHYKVKNIFTQKIPTHMHSYNV